MRTRAPKAGVMVLWALLPAPLWAQGIAIDHKAVGCLVAEKYPKMNACFSPVGQLARARVYFRVADGPPNWYYVEMKSDAPCHAGILPKPKKELIGRKVLYYVNSFDQKFTENRTVDNEALVVGNEGECKKEAPVAPFVTSASVTVLPGLPAGFATGGLGTAAVVAAVAGGAAVVGGGVALGTSGGNNTTTTTLRGGPPLTAPAITGTTTTTTTMPVVPFNPVFNIRVGGFTIPPDASEWLLTGTQQVEFDMCPSTGPTPLHFNVDVAAGARFFPGPPPSLVPPPPPPAVLGGPCLIKVTFSFTSISSPFAESLGSPSPARRVSWKVVAPPGTASSRPRPPSTSETVRPAFTLIEKTPCPAFASATPRRRSSPSDFVRPAFTLVKPLQCYNVRMRVESSGPGNLPKAHRDIVMAEDPTLSGLSHGSQLSWTSKLEVPGASGQVVVNGTTAVVAGPGHSTGMALGPRGENRIEARILQGAGKPGTWRFELGSTNNFIPGSLRVLVGSVNEVSGDAVVFQLSGRAGERVMFSFRTAE